MMDFLVLIVMVMMECQKPLYVMVLLFLFKDGCGIGMRREVRTRKCVDTFFVQVCVNLISLFLGHSFLLSHVVVRRNF